MTKFQHKHKVLVVCTDFVIRTFCYQNFSFCSRGIRKWWQALPPNKKELFKESLRKNKWKLFLGLSSFGLLFVVFYFTHLEVSPVTGRSKLLLFGKEHFRLLSELEYEAVSRKTHFLIRLLDIIFKAGKFLKHEQCTTF